MTGHRGGLYKHFATIKRKRNYLDIEKHMAGYNDEKCRKNRNGRIDKNMMTSTK